MDVLFQFDFCGWAFYGNIHILLYTCWWSFGFIRFWIFSLSHLFIHVLMIVWFYLLPDLSPCVLIFEISNEHPNLSDQPKRWTPITHLHSHRFQLLDITDVLTHSSPRYPYLLTLLSTASDHFLTPCFLLAPCMFSMLAFWSPPPPLTSGVPECYRH